MAVFRITAFATVLATLTACSTTSDMATDSSTTSVVTVNKGSSEQKTAATKDLPEKSDINPFRPARDPEEREVASNQIATGVAQPKAVGPASASNIPMALPREVLVAASDINGGTPLSQYPATPRATQTAAPATALKDSPFTTQTGAKATRIFAGPGEYPPAQYAAYGMLAFWDIPEDQDKKRLTAICVAYLRALDPGPSAGVSPKKQMVTVWPVKNSRVARSLMSDEESSIRTWSSQCELALRFYDIETARQALRIARKQRKDVDGRGPYLLAWSPTDKIATGAAVVLVADLSKAENALQARDIFQIWIRDIESDSAFVDQGFTAEKVRLKLKQLVDRYGSMIEQFFKASS